MKELSEESKRIYAKLLAMVTIHEAEVRSDPIPHLERAGRQICKLHRALESALFLLHGYDDIQLVEDQHGIVRSESFAVITLRRNSKAIIVIQKALNEFGKD